MNKQLLVLGIATLVLQAILFLCIGKLYVANERVVRENELLYEFISDIDKYPSLEYADSVFINVVHEDILKLSRNEEI